MNDLDDAICAVILELSHIKADSLTDLADGACLGQVLLKIDSSFFNPDSCQSSNWQNSFEKVEAFLHSKGIERGHLNVELEAIKGGCKSALTAALLSLLAVIATFNKPGWLSLMQAIGFVHFTSLAKSLQSYKDCLEEAVQGKGTEETPEDSSQLTVYLKKLQRKEEQIEECQTAVEKLHQDKLDQQRTIKSLQMQLQAREAEIDKLTAVKDSLYREVLSREEEAMRWRNDSLSKDKLSALTGEVESLRLKLAKQRKSLIERSAEADRLSSEVKVLSGHKAENMELLAQMEHYKACAGELKKTNEVLECRMQSMGSIQEYIEELKGKLMDQTEANGRMNMELNHKNILIENLQARVDLLGDGRKGGFVGDKNGSGGVELGSVEHNRLLEEQNQLLRAELAQLRASDLRQSQLTTADRMLEKENVQLKTQLASFLSEGEQGVGLERKHWGSVSIDRLGDEQDAVEDKELSFEKYSTDLFQEDQCGVGNMEERDRGRCDDDLALVYSVLMHHHQNELLAERPFAVSRRDRKRNILSKFMLTDIVSEGYY